MIRELLDPSIFPEEFERLDSQMNYLHAEISIPIFLEGHLTAILNMDRKSNNAMYNDLDLAALWGFLKPVEDAMKAFTKPTK